MALACDEARCVIRRQLLAFGVPSGTVVGEVERAIFATGKDVNECSEEEPVRRLDIWRGLTGQVLTEVEWKPQTTAGQVKHDIYLKTGIPIAQQQLFGFGSSDVIQDDVLVDVVPQLQGCEGWQIVVDGPVDNGAVRSTCWVDCQEEEEAELLKKVSGDSSSEQSEIGGHSQQDRRFPPSQGRSGAGRGRRGKGQSKGKQRRDPLAGGAASSGAASSGGGAFSGAAGGSFSNDGSRWQAYEAQPQHSSSSSSTKLQCHIALPRQLQEVGFDVLQRTKPRTKNIWTKTGVSLRLHGPGSGQQEYEQELMLSISAKRNECDISRFNEAVCLAQDLVRSLFDQYRRYCAKVGRDAPEAMGLHSEHGYRRGSQKIRSAG